LTFPLQHRDGDTFVLSPNSELPTFRSTVEFTLDADGPAADVTFDYLAGEGFSTLQRA